MVVERSSGRVVALGAVVGVALVVGASQAAARPGGSVAAIRVTISAPTHTPKVNAPWPVRITASSGGKPVSGTLTMLVLFAGQPVGKIDNGAVYRFHGSWQERSGNEITWPAASRGQPLSFEAVVKSGGQTVRKTWAITVS